MTVTGPDVAAFNGIDLPLPGVLFGFGGGLNKPPADALRLGVGPGLGSGRLGGVTMTDTFADCDGFRLNLGGLGDTGVAESTATLTMDNTRGDYDPDNLLGAFVGVNLLNSQDAHFVGAGIGQWRIGGGVAPGNLVRAASGYLSAGALQITADGVAGIWLVDDANPALSAVPVTPGEVMSMGVHLLGPTRPWHLVHRFLLNGVYVTQSNGPYVYTSPSDWTEVQFANVTVPSGVNQLVTQLETGTTPAAGEVTLADNFRIGRGSTLTAGVSLVDLDVPVAITLTWGGVAYKWFTGILAGLVPNDEPPKPTVAISCIDAVTALGRVKLPESDVPLWDGDTTGGRINRLLDAAGHPTSLRQIDTGRTILGPTKLGNTVRQLVEEVVRTEYGLLWQDGAGVIYFYDRYKSTTAPRSTSVQLTIADTGIMSGLTRAKDRDRFANDWQITRNPLPTAPLPASDLRNIPDPTEEEPVTQQAVDQASIDRYGQETYAEEVGTLLRSDDEARAMAQWGAPLYSTPRMLISQLSADPLRRPNVDWPAFLGLRLLDRVRALRTYSLAASPVDKQLLAKGIELAIDKGSPGQTPTLELAIATDTPRPPEPPDRLRLGGTVGLGSAKLGY